MRLFKHLPTVAVTGVIAMAASVASASPVDPWGFNVYSLGDIGTPGSPYQSDYQGAAGAGGNAHFTGFSLNLLNQGVGTGYSLHVGGNAGISGSITNGGIDAGGNVGINSANVEGPISAGGNLTGTGGTINGAVSLGGNNLAGGGVTINGTLTQGASYTPGVDHAAIASTFLNYSQYVRGLTATTTPVNFFGQLQISASSGVNVVELTSSQINSAWGILVSGPADATVYINVTDTTVAFNSKVWQYAGVSQTNALLNLGYADTFNLNGGDHQINMLAPLADVTFGSGLVTGNLITGNLYGGGQVNVAGRFNGSGNPIPEPATAATLVIAGIGLMLRRPRRSPRSPQLT